VRRCVVPLRPDLRDDFIVLLLIQEKTLFQIPHQTI